MILYDKLSFNMVEIFAAWFSVLIDRSQSLFYFFILTVKLARLVY